MFQRLPASHRIDREISALDRFRADKDRYFAVNPHSPLTSQQRTDFRGLAYFPENPALRQEVSMEHYTGKSSIELLISTGGTRRYQRFGRLTVVIGNERAQLTLFANDHGYFLPFADALAGVETYGSGRSLEPRPLGNGRFLVDFNYAYNPYCAYNDRWSCPITPKENRLPVAIRAGEKLYVEN